MEKFDIGWRRVGLEVMVDAQRQGLLAAPINYTIIANTIYSGTESVGLCMLVDPRRYPKKWAASGITFWPYCVDWSVTEDGHCERYPAVKNPVAAVALLDGIAPGRQPCYHMHMRSYPLR